MMFKSHGVEEPTSNLAVVRTRREPPCFTKRLAAARRTPPR